MAGGGVGDGRGGGEAVVKLEDAVKLLVEHLVEPVLLRGALKRSEALAPEKQEIVARQVHATVLLYNYYHRKQFPHLNFADPRLFSVSACLAAGETLSMYLNQVYDRGGNGDQGAGGLSVTDKAVVDACGIALALDATLDAPEMATWPISKVAVLLVDPIRKRCLIENGTVTKGVWSIPEKDLTTTSTSSEGIPSHPYMLQQTAYSLAESKTGMKRTQLHFLEERLVYSLSKKETTAKLFVVQYEQNVNNNLKEVPLEALIARMSGPIFRSGTYPTTTSVVEFYHVLPYKDVLLDLFNRESCLDFSQSVPKEQLFSKDKSSTRSEINESLKGQEDNSMSNIKKTTPNASVLKKNKLVVKETGNSGINNCRTGKNRKNSNLGSKRKSEALEAPPATCTEHQGGESPIKGNGSVSIANAETLELVSNSANPEPTRETSGGFADLQTSTQMDKNRTVRYNLRNTLTRHTSKVNASKVDPIMKDHASESQIERIAEISVKDDSIAGCVTDNGNDQMYALLQSLQKIRDDILREHCMLGDRSAQLDMDIQAILTAAEEGRMTPRVMSVLKRYENNSSNEMKVFSPTNSGERYQKMNMKRKRLTEAILFRDKCQELDLICRENNWILPRYTVLPSAIDGFYQASVKLICPDLNVSADGDMKSTPCEARNSAATAMILRLHSEAEEKLAELGSGTPAAALLDKTPEK